MVVFEEMYLKSAVCDDKAMVVALRWLPAATLHIPVEKSGNGGMLRTFHIHS